MGACDAEGGVRAGVAEVPGELDAGGFDLKCGEGGSGVAGSGPETFGLDGKEGEEDGEGREGKVFDAFEADGLGVAAKDETEEENDVSKGEEREGNPEIEEEMVIERWAVGAGVGGEEPGGEQKCEGGTGRARDAGEKHVLRIARSIWRVVRSPRTGRGGGETLLHGCPLMKDYLPAIVTVYPYRAAKRMANGLEGDGVGGGAVGERSDVFGQLLAERIA